MSNDLKKRLTLVFGFVFLDLLGYSLILPLFPYYVIEFGASISLVGLLGTVNAFGQLIATPIIGRLSDRYGRRPMLILSIAGTAISFLILGLAKSLLIIFVSRLLDGLLGGNIALARAYITDVTDQKTRARGLGIIGAAFGLGFIIGPAMGGFLSQWGYAFPALVAAILSLINLFAVIFWLPESLPAKERREMRLTPYTAFKLRYMIKELRRPCVGPLVTIQLIYALAFTLFQANYAIFTKEKLGLSAQITSYTLTYVGILSVIVQGLIIGKLTELYKERILIFSGTIIMGASLLAWGFTPNLLFLMIIIAPIALSAGVLNVIINSQLSKAVHREDVGGIMGLSASMQTFAQIVCPGIGGLLFQFIGGWSLGVVSGIFMTMTTIFTYHMVFKKPDLEGPCDRQGMVTDPLVL